MKLNRVNDASLDYERTRSYLLQHEAEHSLMLGLLNALIYSPFRFKHQSYLAIVEEDDIVLMLQKLREVVTMGMTTTTFWAYLLMVSFFVIERGLRQGEEALSLEAGQFDNGSSRLLWTAGLLSLLLMLLAPLLNTYGLGYWNPPFMGWVGIGLVVCGITLRSWAARTLRQFYTRTLRIVGEHHIVERGPYRVIRHPGYLATSIVDIGAGLALNNWIVLLVAKLIIIYFSKLILLLYGFQARFYAT